MKDTRLAFLVRPLFRTQYTSTEKRGEMGICLLGRVDAAGRSKKVRCDCSGRARARNVK